MLIQRHLGFFRVQRPPTGGGGGGGNLVFCMGGLNAGNLTAVDKLDLSALTVASATALNLFGHQSDMCGIGNSTRGIITGGSDRSAGTLKYTYASGTTVAGGSLAVASRGRASTSQPVGGYFWAGDNGTSYITDADFYGFGSDTHTTITALGLARSYAAASGDAVHAIIGGGTAISGGTAVFIATTERYSYTTGANSIATALSAARGFHCAFGNTSRAIFAAGDNSGGFLTSTDKYVYAGDSRTAGATLGPGLDAPSGAGDNSTGLVMGGNGASSTSAAIYAYSLGSDAASTWSASLTSPKYNAATVCTAPGGF